jgi:hypothetical protein
MREKDDQSRSDYFHIAALPSVRGGQEGIFYEYVGITMADTWQFSGYL